jgi:hypothetical protein
VRNWSVFLFLSAAADSAASGPPNAEAVAQLERDGRSLVVACEFKRAARVFETELSALPLSAPKNASRARRNLEEAFKRDPQNHEYLLELFDLYVDSPEWFHGGLPRAAALLERPAESDPEPWHTGIADSWKEHNGPGWWTRRAVLWTSGAVRHTVPER